MSKQNTPRIAGVWTLISFVSSIDMCARRAAGKEKLPLAFPRWKTHSTGWLHKRYAEDFRWGLADPRGFRRFDQLKKLDDLWRDLLHSSGRISIEQNKHRSIWDDTIVVKCSMMEWVINWRATEHLHRPMCCDRQSAERNRTIAALVDIRFCCQERNSSEAEIRSIGRTCIMLS